MFSSEMQFYPPLSKLRMLKLSKYQLLMVLHVINSKFLINRVLKYLRKENVTFDSCQLLYSMKIGQRFGLVWTSRCTKMFQHQLQCIMVFFFNTEYFLTRKRKNIVPTINLQHMNQILAKEWKWQFFPKILFNFFLRYLPVPPQKQMMQFIKESPRLLPHSIVEEQRKILT